MASLSGEFVVLDHLGIRELLSAESVQRKVLRDNGESDSGRGS
jgi:hypothetical protein